MMTGVAEEGTLGEMPPDRLERLAAWLVAQLQRALEWRAEPATAGLLLAGVLAYFSYLNLRFADQLISVIRNTPLAGAAQLPRGLGTAVLFSPYSASMRAIDALILTLGIAEGIAAFGCVVIATRRSRILAVAGLGLALLSRVGGLIVVIGERRPWRTYSDYAIDVVGLLLALWVVTRAGASTRPAPQSRLPDAA